MQITTALPDQLAEQLNLQPDALTRRVLELIVADQYRQGKIGAGEVR
jgi:predicted lipid carrier protein YhbT